MEPEIDVDELAELLHGDATVIDVRQPDEYAAAHVAGTRLAPMDELGGLVGSLDRTHPLYLICRSGNRSATACRALGEMGIRAVNVRGGVEAWLASGRPVEVGHR